jgi:hypothetical protein
LPHFFWLSLFSRVKCVCLDSYNGIAWLAGMSQSTQYSPPSPHTIIKILFLTATSLWWRHEKPSQLSNESDSSFSFIILFCNIFNDFIFAFFRNAIPSNWKRRQKKGIKKLLWKFAMKQWLFDTKQINSLIRHFTAEGGP